MAKNTKDKSNDNNSEIHLGKLIKAELVRQGRSITWLAEQLNCTRANLYKLFRNPWINTQTLFKVCKALDHDFFKDCSEWQNESGDDDKK